MTVNGQPGTIPVDLKITVIIKLKQIIHAEVDVTGTVIHKHVELY